MVVSAAHFTEVTNGYEKRSDGLWLHRGKADVGGLRVNNYLYPQRGAGVDVLYNRSTSTGVVQAYDYDAAAYRDLNIAGRNITLSPFGGTLSLPTGSIGTSSIAANAVQQLLGGYQSTTAFSTTAVNTWVALPAALNVTTAGGLLRMEFSTVLYHSVAAGGFFTGIGWDGAAQVGMSYTQCPGPSYSVAISWVYYTTLSAGAHTITAYVQNSTAGTLTYNSAIYMFLWVTEQKR